MKDPLREQLQLSHATGFLRYAEFYTALSRDLDLSRQPRVLVFGCSNGAELLTNKQFWPEAEILGCDVAPNIIDRARTTAPFATVFRSSGAAVRDHGPYDVIAANSVLCRHPFPKMNYSDVLPYKLFEKYVELLIDCLKLDGYLLIYNTNYFINDLDAASDITPIAVPGMWNNGFVPRVDPVGRLVARPVVVDGMLDRFHLQGEWDPWVKLRAAIFRKARGRILNADETVALPPGTVLPKIELPEISDPTVFGPHHSDVNIAGERWRTTYISNPATGRWHLHGTTIGNPVESATRGLDPETQNS